MVLKVLNFNSFYFCRCLVALKEMIFNSFYFGEGVVHLKNLFLTVSNLGECGGLDRTDF